MRIIHLSDIHFSNQNLKDFKQYYLNSLIKVLSVINIEKKIDLIMITGDLIDKGGNGLNKPYEIFEREFIKVLASKIALDKHTFIFVPGNHDIREELIDEVSETGLKTILTSISKVNGFIDANRRTDIDALKRIKQYKQFERKYYKNFKNVHQITNFESCFTFNIQNKKIGIVCLNSVWRCPIRNDNEKLLLGSRQILNANEFFYKHNCEYNIALMHHPIDQLSNIEKVEINTLLQSSGFLMLLVGHTHNQDTYYKLGNNGNLFVTTARNAFSDPREKIEKFKSGFTIIDIDLLTYNLRLEYKTYYHERKCFDMDLSEADKGVFTTELKPSKEKEEFLRLFKLNNKTLDVNREEINSSLVISRTDSIAPHKLNEIFVLPKLSETSVNIDTENVTKPKLLSLGELIENPKNILLFGIKEIGKTTLLNKLYLEIAENFSKYLKIPVLLDYHELRNRKVRSIISKFLHEDLTSVEELLKENKIVLIIDNIEENENVEYEKKSLLEFVEKYPSTKIIATTSENYEVIASDVNSIIYKLDYKSIFIGPVSIKEFKELAKKWFTKNNPIWIRDNLEKLIKVFEILRIPKTFFSISLFLWIIEKQENFTPVNKANLVSSFLQLILEGLKKENVDAGAYNYTKKIELLTEIAYYMSIV